MDTSLFISSAQDPRPVQLVLTALPGTGEQQSIAMVQVGSDAQGQLLLGNHRHRLRLGVANFLIDQRAFTTSTPYKSPTRVTIRHPAGIPALLRCLRPLLPCIFGFCLPPPASSVRSSAGHAPLVPYILFCFCFFISLPLPSSLRSNLPICSCRCPSSIPSTINCSSAPLFPEFSVRTVLPAIRMTPPRA